MDVVRLDPEGVLLIHHRIRGRRRKVRRDRRGHGDDRGREREDRPRAHQARCDQRGKGNERGRGPHGRVVRPERVEAERARDEEQPSEGERDHDPGRG